MAVANNNWCVIKAIVSVAVKDLSTFCLSSAGSIGAMLTVDVLEYTCLSVLKSLACHAGDLSTRMS